MKCRVCRQEITSLKDLVIRNTSGGMNKMGMTIMPLHKKCIEADKKGWIGPVNREYVSPDTAELEKTVKNARVVTIGGGMFGLILVTAFLYSLRAEFVKAPGVFLVVSIVILIPFTVFPLIPYLYTRNVLRELQKLK